MPDEDLEPLNEYSLQEMERRNTIEKIACEYRIGDRIPDINYTAVES